VEFNKVQWKMRTLGTSDSERPHTDPSRGCHQPTSCKVSDSRARILLLSSPVPLARVSETLCLPAACGHLDVVEVLLEPMLISIAKQDTDLLLLHFE
jgi:hypothetical protein